MQVTIGDGLAHVLDADASLVGKDPDGGIAPMVAVLARLEVAAPAPDGVVVDEDAE